jgi:predicted DCC family thiol-disulfide oxidoreductase YuxK
VTTGDRSRNEAEETPDGLWVYDGVCRFCSGSVRLALALDRKGVVRFTPVQSPYGRRLLEQAGLDPEAPTSFLFFDRGRALSKSDAALALASRLPAPWRALGGLRLLPRSWRDGAYDWIARNRFRLLGRRRTCFLPSPDQRARFILEPPT